jgi:hypothetical protein
MTNASQDGRLDDQLTVELGAYLRLTGGGWHPDDKQEWIAGAADELQEYPMSLVLPELAKARKREPWPNKLVSRVVDAIEPRVARLEAERAMLDALQDIADDRGNVT